MGELTVEAYRNFSRHKIEENNPGVVIVNWDYSSPVRISYEGHEYRAVCSKSELMKALGKSIVRKYDFLSVIFHGTKIQHLFYISKLYVVYFITYNRYYTKDTIRFTTSGIAHSLTII